MAKLGDLVVHIGANTKNLNDSLGRAQRNMRSMTRNFTALGQQMTRSITLPILGIGAMAIKSAADLEKMEVSFISLTGGAKQAADMMKQLNEFTANTPFQIDAVATSARQLIASGTKISEVNEQLQFLGDIAATTGQPINEIAAIFSKVNAKGKVELESLNQLAERGIPIFKALSDATGLLPSELGAGRVSVEQFNATLKSFNEEGGLAEGAMDKLSKTAAGKFSTALDNLKLAGAALAEDLLPPINALLDSIINLAKKFTGLSDSTKKIIIVVGTFLATLGPMLIILPQIIAAFSGMTAAVIGMNIALAANPVVLAATAIAILTAAVVGYNLAADNATIKTESWRKQLKFLSNEEAKGKLNEGLDTTLEMIILVQDQVDRAQKAYDKTRNASTKRGLDTAKQDLERWLTEKDMIAAQILDLDNKISSSEIIPDIEKAEDYNKKLDGLLLRLRGINTVITQDLTNGIQTFTVQSSGQLLDFLDDFSTGIEGTTTKINEVVEFTTTAFSNLGKQIGDVFASAIVDGENFVDGLKNMVKSIIKILISEAISHAITSASSSTNVANQASGGLTIPAFIAAAVGSVKAAFGSVPALAEGGIAFGRSLVEVGEYSGASGNPEVIAPLSKLKDMIGGNSIQVYGRISGDDIVISNDRATRDRNRF